MGTREKDFTMKLLSTKIFIGYLLVICLLTGMIVGISYNTIKNHYNEAYINDLKNINYSMHEQVSQYLLAGKFSELDTLVKRIGNNINHRITVISPNGIVLADSQRDPKQLKNHSDRPEIVDAIKQSFGSSIRYSTSVQDDMMYVAMPLKNDNKLIGVLRLSISLESLSTLAGKLTFDILKVSVVVLFITLLLVLFFSKTVTKQINHLSVAARKVSSGDFDVQLKIRGKDEIAELIVNFNNMTSRLKQLFEKVLSQKEEFITLIRSIKDGLVVLDTNGVVLLSNSSFCDIIGASEIVGRYYYEVIPESQFANLFNQIVKKRNSFTDEIEMAKHDFLCSASFIESSNEIVFLLHDITEIKKVERIKRDFVINVSHELRTPLTAIKGFVETLEDELDGKEDSETRHYLDIISRHTDRLITIVQDLLLLSKLEETGMQLLVSSVDIKKLIENLLKIFEQKLAEKNLKILCDFENSFPQIQVDPFKMEQVFVNLIDNAIKYTDEGEIRIRASIKENVAVIIVEDTGLGIPKEDLHRIFERFYIVDKSRSRKVGGSGLGLSIVKHIVLLHNGTIDVESERGAGTRFIIRLPITHIKSS